MVKRDRTLNVQGRRSDNALPSLVYHAVTKGMEQWHNGNQQWVELKNQLQCQFVHHLGLNPRLHRQKPPCNCLMYNTALQCNVTAAVTTATITVKLKFFSPSLTNTSLYRICARQKGTETGFSDSTSVLPFSIIPPMLHIHLSSVPYDDGHRKHPS